MKPIQNFVFATCLAATSAAYGANCQDNDNLAAFCADMWLAEACLEAHRDCDAYVSEAIVHSVYLLGKIEVRAHALAADNQLQGEVGTLFRRFVAILNDNSWQGSSIDRNWILAVDKVNQISDRVGRGLDALAD